KLSGRQCPPGHACRKNRALEIVTPVNARSDRACALALRCQGNLRRPFQIAIDVIPECASIVGRGRVMPDAERVQQRSVHQRLSDLARMRVAIEAPTSFANSNFKEQARVLSASLKMEEPLFRRSIRIRPEDYFPRESFGAREGVKIQKQGVLTTIELDRFT